MVARVDLEATKIDFTLADKGAGAAIRAAIHPAYSAPLTRADRPRSPKRAR
jgi:hypothetical protein